MHQKQAKFAMCQVLLNSKQKSINC